MTRLRLFPTLAVLCVGLSACGEVTVWEEAPSDPSQRQEGGLSAAPEIVIKSPANLSNIPMGAINTPVTVEFAVAGMAIPGEGHVVFTVDGGNPVQHMSTGPFVYANVPKGQHTLAAQLVLTNGTPLTNPQSRAVVKVKIVADCAADGDCADGNPCTIDVCQAGVASKQCKYGPVSNQACCLSAMDCSFGWSCIGNQCVQCQSDTQCSDGNICTADSCVSGVCKNTAITGCCSTSTACNDGNPCTSDSCNLLTSSCTFSPISGCCATAAQCADSNPCTTDACIGNVCRYGPKTGCCTDDLQCNDKDACTLDSCNLIANTCNFVPDPAKPNCCKDNNACDDGDQATLDKCVQGVCTYVQNPDFCVGPAVAQLVINEIMVNPKAVTDVVGEWIELYNPGKTSVNIAGWSISDTGTDFHSLPTGSPLTIAPGGFFVLGNNPETASNGGIVLDYAYTNFTLANGGDEVILKKADGTIVAEVQYSSANGFPVTDGASYALKHPYLSNNVGSSFAISTALYGKGDFGTPKAKNTDVYSPPIDPGCDDGNPCTDNVCQPTNQCGIEQKPNCCSSNANCNDGKPCTKDTCDQTTNTCVFSPPTGPCCNTGSDCDDGNPCTTDACIGLKCRYGPNQSKPGCCINDGMCDDKNPCTEQTCDLAQNICEYEPIGDPLCCVYNVDCEDNDPSTLNKCLGGSCQFPPDPTYCTLDTQCNDGLVCTADKCDLAKNKCVASPLAGCCVADIQCGDGDVCTLDVCDPVQHVCKHPPKPGCCKQDSHCNDNNACTADQCLNYSCRYTDIAGCCTTNSDCATTNPCIDNVCDVLTKVCVPAGVNGAVQGCCITNSECNDNNGCTTDKCVQNICQNTYITGCCQSALQCNDQDPCTVDYCIFGKCKSVAKTGACCLQDSECVADSSACTTALCLGGQCVQAWNGTCPAPLPFEVSDWALDGGASAAAWSVENGEVLPGWYFTVAGPKFSATTAPESIWDVQLSSPLLNGMNASKVTVQWTQSVVPGVLGGNDELMLMASATGLAPFVPVVTETATLAAGSTALRTANVPILALAPSGRIAFRVSRAQGGVTDMNWSIGSVVVAPGSPPAVNGFGGALPGAVSTLTKYTLTATDTDPGDVVSFSLSGTPGYVSLANYKNNGNGTFSIDIVLFPEEGDQGSASGTIIVSDGLLQTPVVVGFSVVDQPVCPNGVAELGEQCDDGNTTDTDGCTNSCLLASCGDGVVQATAGEQCDLGGQNSNTGACTMFCKLPSCGDGYVQANAGELCDLGINNNSTGNFCTQLCKLPVCGDGFIQAGKGEQCDAGPQNGPVGACSTQCKPNFCGDGVVQAVLGEQCDNGANNSDTLANACRSDCSNPSCGDGVKDAGDSCDDGNNTPGDGCENNCTITVPTVMMVITEIMADPNAVSDTVGEWFEIYNPGDVSMNINGWTIKSKTGATGTESHTINSLTPVFVPAQGYLIVGNGSAAINGGAPTAYVYGGIVLAQGTNTDYVQLVDPLGTTHDTVNWSNVGNGKPPIGASWQLKLTTSDNTQVVDGLNVLLPQWCVSTVVFAPSTDKGSPAQASNCP